MYVKDQLAQMYGEDVLNHGGLTIQTTLDLPTQSVSESVISSESKTCSSED